jgi:hypothetical protein
VRGCGRFWRKHNFVNLDEDHAICEKCGDCWALSATIGALGVEFMWLHYSFERFVADLVKHDGTVEEIR